MVQTLAYTFDAGVLKSVNSGASPLEINDIKKVVLSGDAVSRYAIRTRGKVINVAGVTNSKTLSTQSVAYRN